MTQDGKEIYIVANWKSHKTWNEAEAFLTELKDLRAPDGMIQIIAVPYPFVKSASELVTEFNLPVKLAVQDVSPFPYGTYTGAVAAGMLEAWVDYAIVGHSERRKWFKETDQDTANKVIQLLDHQITPIVCVDKPYIGSQIAALEQGHLSRCLFVYEPSGHISDGVHLVPDTPENAQKEAEHIAGLVGHSAPVLYGGSVSSSTLVGFLSQPDIQGVLVGGASLEVDSWKALVQVASG